MAAVESKPCWINENLPPPVALDYDNKGIWKQMGDLQTYAVGPSTATKAILLIFDIFGPSSQVLQGADRLATHMNSLVFVPDLFHGEAPTHDDFVKHGRAILAQLKEKHADIDKNVRIVLDFVPTLESQYPSVEAWGIFGLCWGGKVAVKASTIEGHPFKASGQTHPGLLAVEDAEKLKVPHILLPSKDEPADVVDEYERVLKEKDLGKVDRFNTMFHGWMGARADLNDKENSIEYQRGYRVTAEFFAEVL